MKIFWKQDCNSQNGTFLNDNLLENETRREFLILAASGFVVARLPWLDFDPELSNISDDNLWVEAGSIDWGDVLNTVIGNTNRCIAFGGEKPIYERNSPKWIMEKVLDHHGL